MVFLNGWLLALGVAAVSVPIVLHFMARNRPKPTPFPTIRWLSEAIVTNRRRVRLKQWILLALRGAILAWLGLTLAHPSVAAASASMWGQAGLWGLFALAGLGFAIAIMLSRQERSRWWIIGGLGTAILAGLVACVLGLGAWWSSRGTELQGGQGSVSAILLLDVAPRMEYVFDGETRLERAQGLADSVLAELPEGSRAAVIDSSNATPFFAVDLAAARRQLEGLKTRYLHLPLPTRLRQALSLFDGPSETRRELYVFTDLTREAWPEGPDLTSLAEQLGEQGIALYVIDVRAERDENLALSLPRLARESITSPGSLELEIDVLNRGAARTVNLDLELEQPDASRPSYRDGEVIVPDRTWSRTASVDLPEAGSATVSLAIPDLPLGVHQGRVRLRPSDALSFDNTRYLTIEVRQPWRCLVFAAPETRSSVLIEAVTPTAERLAGRSVFAFETATYTEFGKYRLEDFEAVFLLDPGPMDPASWELLSDYVRGGGALSLFLGPSAEVVDTAGLGFREVHPSFVSPESRLVLPGKPTFVWNSPGSGVLLSPRDYAHPLLRPLRGFETSVPWTEFPVNQHWGWEFPADDSNGSAAEGDDDVDRREPPGPAQVVIGYSDGTPAVLQADVEEGTVWVWTTPIGESVGASSPDRWNQLTVGDCWPYFLLMNQLSATMVTADTSRLNLLVGETAEMTWRGDGAPEALTFYSPNGGEPERLRGDHGLWRVRFTETPGAYRFKGGSDEIRTLGFAVNPAESDSDLNALPEAWWEEAFPDASVQLAQAVDELRRQQGTARQGRDFFETLLMWLPVLMAVEFLFASLSQQRPGTGTTRGGGGETRT